jgi:hypothetical protein
LIKQKRETEQAKQKAYSEKGLELIQARLFILSISRDGTLVFKILAQMPRGAAGLTGNVSNTTFRASLLT